MSIRSLAVSSVLFLASIAGAQTGTTAMLPANSLPSFGIYGPATAKTVSVAGQPFSQAADISILAATNPTYSIQYRAPLTGDIASGDVLLVSFYWRCISPVGGDSQALVGVMQQSSPFSVLSQKLLYQGSSKWKQFTYPMVATAAYPSGTMSLKFSLGYEAQEFQIGGVAVTNYHQTTTVSQLPESVTYGGHESNALWRAAAATRIKQYRTGPISVIVKDKNGSPVPNASVNVFETRNAFDFGSCVSEQFVLWNKPDSANYLSNFSKLFNTATPENQLKWPQFEANNSYGLNTVKWLNSNSLSVRGHNLIWPDLHNDSWHGGWVMPSDCLSLAPAALRTRIDAHFADEQGKLAGQVEDWDVVNEPYWNHDVQGLIPGVPGVTPSAGVLGNAEIVHWFQNAHALDPNAKLYLNDGNLLEQNGAEATHIVYIQALIKYLTSNNAPIYGVGLESHFNDTLTAMDTAWNLMNIWAGLGMHMKITEFDLSVNDPQLQSDYLRDLLTLAFSHPQMDGFINWGFWAGSMFTSDSAMFNQDWTITPKGQTWKNLVLGTWITKKAGTTDATGTYATTGYTGTYNVSVTYNGVKTTVPTQLTTAGTTVTVNLNQ